ncbi:hypothetical protein [uncultured Bacteroides sp.]|uniref:hypothetical protein n=1 Tax=uncultured Bacteroides sp. TaxID=162156 RepID=UPI002636B59B|nr:hypothetical protein [uncultured Bacteroides sp.]
MSSKAGTAFASTPTEAFIFFTTSCLDCWAKANDKLTAQAIIDVNNLINQAFITILELSPFYFYYQSIRYKEGKNIQIPQNRKNKPISTQ